MKLILRNISNEFIKSISLKTFVLSQNFFDELKGINYPMVADLITANEEINSSELAKLKIILEKHNIKLSQLYSKNRETVISGIFKNQFNFIKY